MSEKLKSVDQVNKQPEPSIRDFKFPTEIIKLPSKGLVYSDDSPLSKGTIEVKHLTAKEEDILATDSYISQGVVLDKVCESIIVTPNVKYDDLLVGDKNALLLAVRMYGYGHQYETSVATSDGREIPVTIDLREVPHKEFNEDLLIRGENKFKFKLPISDIDIEFRLLTVGDQKKIDAEIKAMNKLGKMRSSQNLTTRLRYMIKSVNGNEDQSYINKFVPNILASDSRAFREYIQQIQPDIDLGVEVEDPQTGEPFRGDFKVGLDILYPDFKG